MVGLDADGQEIRTIWLKGEQWWVAVDVCGAIEIVNPWNALVSLDADEKGLHQMETPGGLQQMAVVNEPGLYHLLSKSNKPKAKEFWRWVRHEVLLCTSPRPPHPSSPAPAGAWCSP